jgi:hypothetical protein
VKKTTTINESTLIPLSFLLVVLSAVAYVVTIHGKVQANVERIEKVEKKNDELGTVISDTRDSLMRIEGALGIKSPDKK